MEVWFVTLAPVKFAARGREFQLSSKLFSVGLLAFERNAGP